MSLLEIERLSVRYGSDTALEDVSLRVAAGEVVGLVGRSGSGKSTLAAAVSALLPDEAEIAGAVRIDGRPVSPAARGRLVGTIFQEPATALNPALTVGGQVAEVLRAGGLRDRRRRDAAVAALLSRVGLAIDPGRYPHDLSGGQRQRVGIAMAIAAGSKLLVADEPTAALDPVARDEIAGLLRRLVAQERIGLLLVSHDLPLVAGLADRIAVLDAGRLVEEGPAAGRLRRPASATLAALSAPAAPAMSSAGRGAPLLVATDVARTFREARCCWSRRGTLVLDGLSLEVASGETVAVVGTSGSGKTTLARLALGLDRPDRGAIHVDGVRWTGRVAADRPLRRRVQAVFQDPADSLDPAMAVGAIVAEPLGLLSPPPSPAARAAHAAAALAEVGLPADAAERLPHAFSGGQRQRIALARALVLRPDLLVLDEALSALDPDLQAEVAALLVRLQAERGLALLLITHDLQLAGRLAHGIAVVDAGRIVEQGETAALLATPRHPVTAALVAASPGLEQALDRHERDRPIT